MRSFTLFGARCPQTRPYILDIHSHAQHLSGLIRELKAKYLEKRYEDTVAPRSVEDRTKVSDGLPYFHPTDNGFQLPFEKLLYDPRFKQKAKIEGFHAKHISSNSTEINAKNIERDKLWLPRIATFSAASARRPTS